MSEEEKGKIKLYYANHLLIRLQPLSGVSEELAVVLPGLCFDRQEDAIAFCKSHNCDVIW